MFTGRIREVNMKLNIHWELLDYSSKITLTLIKDFWLSVLVKWTPFSKFSPSPVSTEPKDVQVSQASALWRASGSSPPNKDTSATSYRNSCNLVMTNTHITEFRAANVSRNCCQNKPLPWCAVILRCQVLSLCQSLTKTQKGPLVAFTDPPTTTIIGHKEILEYF